MFADGSDKSRRNRWLSLNRGCLKDTRWPCAPPIDPSAGQFAGGCKVHYFTSLDPCKRSTSPAVFYRNPLAGVPCFDANFDLTREPSDSFVCELEHVRLLECNRQLVVVIRSLYDVTIHAATKQHLATDEEETVAANFGSPYPF